MRRNASRAGLAALPLALAAVLGPATFGAAPAAAENIETGRVVFVADGDTVDVDVDGDGTTVPVRIRITGLNAMELTTYSRDLTKIVGECHGVEATKRMHGLVFGKQVRLVSRFLDSRSGTRTRRSVWVQDSTGTWVDTARILVQEGHALWLPNIEEYDHNLEYSTLAEQAAARGVNLWDTDYCGVGPDQDVRLRLAVNWNAPGDDSLNPNGEYFYLTNPGTKPVSLDGWWVRDSHLRRYTFPAGTVLPAGGDLYVHPGKGVNTGNHYYWNLDGPVFENVSGDPTYNGDGGYLFDPQGDLRAWQQYPCRTTCPPVAALPKPGKGGDEAAPGGETRSGGAWTRRGMKAAASEWTRAGGRH